MDFEWDEIKNKSNIIKHQISFEEAQYAFVDTKRVIAIDHKHSTKAEIRYFCYGMLDDRVITVRFTYRAHKIRIFGAGYWREGYEKYFKEKRKEN